MYKRYIITFRITRDTFIFLCIRLRASGVLSTSALISILALLRSYHNAITILNALKEIIDPIYVIRCTHTLFPLNKYIVRCIILIIQMTLLTPKKQDSGSEVLNCDLFSIWEILNKLNSMTTVYSTMSMIVAANSQLDVSCPIFYYILYFTYHTEWFTSSELSWMSKLSLRIEKMS